MATRTIKFMGKAVSTDGSDVSLVVNFNSTEVHNGTVTTDTVDPIPATHGGLADDDKALSELFSFTIDSSVEGDIPVSIAVSGGDLFWGYFAANQCGSPVEWDGSTRDGDGYKVLTQLEDPATTFRDPNENTDTNDGKKNIQIDSAAPEDSIPTTNVGDPGEWTYHIENGSTLTCDYVVQPGVNA